ncbi:unnamed protein product, partial [Urochloa humidicola]
SDHHSSLPVFLQICSASSSPRDTAPPPLYSPRPDLSYLLSTPPATGPGAPSRAIVPPPPAPSHDAPPRSHCDRHGPDRAARSCGGVGWRSGGGGGHGSNKAEGADEGGGGEGKTEEGPCPRGGWLRRPLPPRRFAQPPLLSLSVVAPMDPLSMIAGSVAARSSGRFHTDEPPNSRTSTLPSSGHFFLHRPLSYTKICIG